MSGTTIVIAVVVVLAIIALVLVLTVGRRGQRSRGLRQRFGPEYERTVQETGSREEAERQLTERVHRHRELQIRELDPAARARYVEEWRVIQSRFVDDPKAAVGEADDLVASLMRDLGYPTESFEQQAADVSVDHAEVVPSYRRAHELATAREAATDDLRQAMVHYRELFEDLLGARAWQPGSAAAGAQGDGRPPAEPAAEEQRADQRADERAVQARREGR
jgi:hypothetical protein